MTRGDSVCARCAVKFSFFRSARRCRCCGGNFCPQCSDCAAPVELVQSLSRAAGPLRDDAEAAAMAENAYLQEASAKTARVCQSCFDSLFVYIVVDIPTRDDGGCQPGASPFAPRARRFRSRCECLRLIERTCGPLNVAAALGGLLPVAQPSASEPLPWRRLPLLVVHTSDVNVVFAQCPAGGMAERRALFDRLLQCAVADLERTMCPRSGVGNNSSAPDASRSGSVVHGGLITSPLFSRAGSGSGRFPSPWCGAPTTGSVAGSNAVGAAAIAPRCGRVPETVVNCITMDAGGLYADCHFIAGHVTDAFRRVAPVPPPAELLTEPTASAAASAPVRTAASTSAGANGASGRSNSTAPVSPNASLPSTLWGNAPAASTEEPHGAHGRRGICTLFAAYAPPAAVFLPPHLSPAEITAATAAPAWRFRWIQPGVYTDRELKSIIAEFDSAVCGVDAGLSSDDPHRGVAFVGVFRVDLARVASYLDDVRVATVLSDYDELQARVAATTFGGGPGVASVAAAAATCGVTEPLRQAVREVAAKSLYKHGLECIASAKSSTFASTAEFIERCASALLASDDLLLDATATANGTSSSSATVERVFARAAKMQRAPPQQAVQPLPLRFLKYSMSPTAGMSSSFEGDAVPRDASVRVELLSGAFHIVRSLASIPDPASGPYVILSSAGELVAYDAPDVATMRRLAAAGGREVLQRIHRASLVAFAPRVFLLHDPQFPTDSPLRRAHAGLQATRERESTEGRPPRPPTGQPASRGLLFTAATSLWEMEAATRGAVCTAHAAWVYDAATRDVRPFITPFLFVPPPGGNSVELAGAWRDQVSTWANQAAGILAPTQPSAAAIAAPRLVNPAVALPAAAGPRAACEPPSRTHSASDGSVGIATVASEVSPTTTTAASRGASVVVAPDGGVVPGSPPNIFQRFIARLAASISTDAPTTIAAIPDATSAPASPIAVPPASSARVLAAPQVVSTVRTAAAADEDSVDLSCPVCLDRFDRDARRPLVLPCCGHSVCATCWGDVASRAVAAAPKPVKAAAKKGPPQPPPPVTAQCPLDRAQVDVTRPLVVNRALMQLLFRGA